MWKDQTMEIYSFDKYDEMLQTDIDYIGGLFPKGKLSMVVAEGGIGKTDLLVKATLAVTKNQSILPGSYYTTEGKNVMVIETENRRTDWMTRVRVAGGDSKYYYFPRSMYESVTASNPDDLKRILDCLNFRPVEMVVVDSLLGFNPSADENTGAVAPGIDFLSRIAELHNIAVVSSHYLNKSNINKKIHTHNIRGHSSYSQYPQVIWALEKTENEVRKLYQIKNNLSALDPVVYKYISETDKIRFLVEEPKKSTDSAANRLDILYTNYALSDREIAELIHKQEPNQQLHNLIKWVIRRRKK